MASSEDFEDIRPYRDEEVPDVLARTVQNPSFERLMRYVYPDVAYEQLASEISAITTVDEFQGTSRIPPCVKPSTARCGNSPLRGWMIKTRTAHGCTFPITATSSSIRPFSTSRSSKRVSVRLRPPSETTSFPTSWLPTSPNSIKTSW